MSTITEKTARLFGEATVAESDLGYPDDVEFLPCDQDWTDEALWRNLLEGQPTVVVGEMLELLLLPAKQTVGDRLKRRVRVRIGHRVHGLVGPYMIHTVLGRHPMRDIRAQPVPVHA